MEGWTGVYKWRGPLYMLHFTPCGRPDNPLLKNSAGWRALGRVPKCAGPEISYTPVSEWFRKNPKLVDEHGTPILEGRKPKRSRCLGRADNDMETVIEEAFANMDDGMEDMKD
jgi:hypothetical protein